MGLRKGVFGAAAGALAVVLTLSACGASGSKGAGNGDEATKKLANKFTVDWNPQPRDKIKDGGTVTIPVTEIPSQENTMAVGTTTASAAIWNWYNPQLTFLTPEGKWSYNKDYLTDVTHTEKGGNTVVTYTLNPKAVWNDGTPMSWKSFELTWKSCNGSDSKYQTTGDCSNITSVKQGENNRQAVVTYDGPYAWWQSGFGAILNPHITNADVFNNAYQNKLQSDWGAGPYTVDSANFKTGRITFKRNPRWWETRGSWTGSSINRWRKPPRSTLSRTARSTWRRRLPKTGWPRSRVCRTSPSTARPRTPSACSSSTLIVLS